MGVFAGFNFLLIVINLWWNRRHYDRIYHSDKIIISYSYYTHRGGNAMIFTNELLNYDNASNNIPANINGDQWWSKASDKFSFWCVMCHDWCQGFGRFWIDCRACDWVRRWVAVFQIRPKKWHRHHEYERRPMTQNNAWRSAQLVDIAVLAWFCGSWHIAYRLADLMPLRRCQWQSWASA